MSCKKHFVLFFCAACAVAMVGCADSPKDSKAAPPEMPLPPGWTKADMEACMMAGAPGPMHERLAKDVGSWNAKTTMWMYPGAQPMPGTGTFKVTSMMDGRYFKGEMKGEMPGMGPYTGMGITGYDNVSKKFVSTWIDNQSTGIMYGTGDLSADGKTINWTFTYNCPIQKKAVTMRQTDTNIGPNSKKLEMFGAEPKSGQDFKMMSIEFTRK
jgi:hypothetical protein